MNTSSPRIAPSATPPVPTRDSSMPHGSPPHTNQKQPPPTSLTVADESFTPFDYQSIIIGPFEEEANKESEFQQQFTAQLLDAMLEFHAWATTRPKHEEQLASERLEKSMQNVIQIEKKQGTSQSPRTCFEITRARLRQFVDQMRTAIAALAGPLPF